jgi:hypothetical protein
MDALPLGRHVQVHHFVMHGQLTIDQWLGFIADVVATIDMECSGEPVVRQYPIDGKGGYGATIFQAITTSYIVLDTWPQHNGAYLALASCKKFNPLAVRGFIANKVYPLLLISDRGHDLEIPSGLGMSSMKGWVTIR